MENRNLEKAVERYRPADGRTPESELPSEDELYQQSSKQ